jgi:two-component system nitrogen regulation response regulator NtrX
MKGGRILLVDDDPAILRGVGGILRDEGFETVTARNTAEAERGLAGPGTPDLMLLDLGMPGEGGLAFLRRLPRPLPAPVVVLSGEASPTDAVTALQLGAVDFIEKPPSPERLVASVRNALALTRLSEEREELRRALAQPGNLVGASAAMAELRSLIERVGPSEAVVLINGETGAGKERVARALHLASGRKGRFVAINCAAVPATLLESELFGHERGAFTGAANRHLGRFEQAEGGTLFLDEIGDMPLELQAKLLRVLEQREVERLGGSKPIAVDVRVLAATHRDLQTAITRGQFRQDLYFRLAVFPLRVPPLRERPDDLAPLIAAFAAELLGPEVPVTSPRTARPPCAPTAGRATCASCVTSSSASSCCAGAARCRSTPPAPPCWPSAIPCRPRRRRRPRRPPSSLAARATASWSTTSNAPSSARRSSAPAATWPPPPACCTPIAATSTGDCRRWACTGRTIPPPDVDSTSVPACPCRG